MHVKAQIINTGLANMVWSSSTYSGWQGHEVLASKKAVAVFDRGWRWAYWDDRINEGCPYYDPFQMVGSRPCADAAYQDGGSNILPTYAGMLYDNEMCHYNDWNAASYSYIRTQSADQVMTGYVSPAEYSGKNRPGDDCAQRARIVFFQWVGH
jgi:hypothetical protein